MKHCVLSHCTMFFKLCVPTFTKYSYQAQHMPRPLFTEITNAAID